MDIVLWVVQVLTGIIFLMAGFIKATQPKEELAKSMGWVKDFSAGHIRTIGTLEILGAVGLVLPALTGNLPWLTPLAAIGLALNMLGAALTHLRRSEIPNIFINLVLMMLSIFVAYGRFFAVPL